MSVAFQPSATNTRAGLADSKPTTQADWARDGRAVGADVRLEANGFLGAAVTKQIRRSSAVTIDGIIDASKVDEDTRSRIVREATHLFQEHGYSQTTIRMIAQRVGITPPALYWHFPSKDAILFAFLDSGLDETDEMVKRAVIGKTPEERLRRLVHALVCLRLKRTDISPIRFGLGQLSNMLSAKQQRHLTRRQRNYLDLVRGLINEGIEAKRFAVADITTAAFAIITMCDYVILWYRVGGRLDPDAIASQYEDMAIKMLLPRR